MISLLYLIEERVYCNGQIETSKIILATDKKAIADKMLAECNQPKYLHSGTDYFLTELSGEELDLL